MSVTYLESSDILAITSLVHRLCQSLDYSRPNGFVAAFTPDGIYQAVSSTATGEEPRFRHAGSAELRSFAESAVAKRQGLGRHWTGNLLVEAVPGDADAARATSYVLFVEIDATTKERRIPISGTHRDTFVRTPEGWRFTSRTVVADV